MRAPKLLAALAVVSFALGFTGAGVLFELVSYLHGEVPMPILLVLFILVVIGIALYYFNLKITKIDPSMKKGIVWLVLLLTLVWVLSMLFPGWLGHANDARVTPIVR